MAIYFAKQNKLSVKDKFLKPVFNTWLDIVCLGERHLVGPDRPTTCLIYTLSQSHLSI